MIFYLVFRLFGEYIEGAEHREMDNWELKFK